MTRDTTERWRIARTLEPTLGEVDRVCTEVRRRFKPRATTDDWYGVELLLREALTNAVRHGGDSRADTRVRCEVRVSPTKATLTVEDEGPGFDWRRALHKETPETATGGRGLKIYELYADRVSFNEAGNRVVLERRLNRRSGRSTGLQPRGEGCLT